MATQLPRDFGPYVLEKLISAEGGQGTVYLATHKALEKRVVIKILRDHLAKHESFVERFAAEASQLAKMDHANIVRVRQSGPSGEEYFIEMEHLEGWDLGSWLKQHGRLPVEIAILVLQRIASGLQHAHERSLIHRDVKPGNVMLTPSGGVKVLDFGLARDMDAAGLSTPGALMGTYAYMSPEQVDGAEATTLFDVYSLGVVAYQLLSGRIPFEGSIATVCMKIQNEEPPPLDRLCPEAPGDLVKLVQRMMAKKPARRPRDLREVEEGLAGVARHLGIRASEDLLTRYVADPVAALDALQRRRQGRRWRPLVPAAAAVVLVLLVGGGMAVIGRRQGAAPAPVEPSSDSSLAARAADPLAGAAAPAVAETTAAAVAPAPLDTAHVAAPHVAATKTPPTPPPGGADAVAPVTPAPASGTLGEAAAVVPMTLSADSVVVDVTVAPAGDIYVEGVNVATHATHWARRVLRRRWTVRVDCGDYGTREQKKKPRAEDAVLAFAFDLSVGEGGVHVTGPRSGLAIYVDGAFARVYTPSQVRPLPVGPHIVEVRDRKSGEVVATRQVIVKQGQSNVEVDLSTGH